MIPNQKTEKRREKKENRDLEKLVDCKEASKHLLKGGEWREAEEMLSSGLFLIQGAIFHWYPSKKLKYGQLRLGESTST